MILLFYLELVPKNLKGFRNPLGYLIVKERISRFAFSSIGIICLIVLAGKQKRRPDHSRDAF
jgi:hypothetical protein